MLQTAYQSVAKRDKMRRPHSKVRMLTTRINDDGLEHFAFIEGTNDGGNHVHQLKLLPFHIVREQASRIGRKLEESAVKYFGEFSTNRPQRIERISNEANLLGRHDRREIPQNSGPTSGSANHFSLKG